MNKKAKIEALQELAKGEHTSKFMIGMVAADQELKALRSELNSLKQLIHIISFIIIQKK